MKILLVSHQYSPFIGGIETLSKVLAKEFSVRGHEVVVLTYTAGLPVVIDANNVTIVRAPSILAVLRYTKWADVVFHNNLVTRMAWPMLFVRRPWVVASHTWVRRNNGTISIVDRVKRFLLKFAINISVSQALADDVSVNSTVIPNSYDDELFRRIDGVSRDFNSIVFVGRLVKDKGVSVLLKAVAELLNCEFNISLSVIGDGPERSDLELQMRNLNIEDNVTFLGSLRDEALVREMNTHGTIVIPSIWAEPFGLVALEGMACGCVVVASETGGLPEAVGGAGLLFPSGEVGELVSNLRRIMTEPDLRDDLRIRSDIHLVKHSVDRMVNEYISVLSNAAITSC